MRRSVFLLSPVLPRALGGLALVGCEDGPQQTFSPAPANAASIYNNSGDASTSDPASQQFDASSGGTNAVNICTPAEQIAQWTIAFSAPIVPPFQGGGADLSVGNTFANYTIEDAEHGATIGSVVEPKLCQGIEVPAGCPDGTGNPFYEWGPSQQLDVCYDIASHNLTFFYFLPGYSGKMTFSLPATYNGVTVPAAVDQNGKAGALNYVWEIGQPLTENGVPLNFGWTGSGTTHKIANKLYLALMATFQPTLLLHTTGTLTQITDPAFDCLDATLCRTSANPDGSGGNFGTRPAGIYGDFSLSNSTDVATSATSSDMYMYPVKFEPYSLSSYNMGLDSFNYPQSPNADPARTVYGPYAPAGVLSPTGAKVTPFCTLFMGETFGDFNTDCVNVTGTASIDNLSVAKLLGAQHHTAEWYQFSTVGVNQNFSADTAELTQGGQPSILADTQGTIANPPHTDDQATNFIVDVRASGAKLNDMRGDSVPASSPAAGATGESALDAWEDANLAGEDLHGSSAIVGYYRQLVYNDLKRLLTASGVTPPADPTTCWFNSQGGTVGLPAGWFPPAGCTGFEQMVTPAIPSGAADPAGYLPSAVLDLTPQNDPIKSFFQPGDPDLQFYADPRTGVGGNAFVTAPNLMQSSLLQVVAMIGHGNPAAVPSAARDWRYYLQFWAQAFTKYLLNRHLNPTWQQLYADDLLVAQGKPSTMKQVNQDNLFFDLENGIDRFEYIDRSNAIALKNPIDFSYDILLNSSNVQDENYFQRLTRAESALYTSQLGATADTGPGVTPLPTSKKTDPPGSNENVNLSDLFGAPAIVNAGFCSTPSANPAKDAFYCCTTPNDADCTAAHATPPTDSSGNMLVDGQGRPLFTNYQGVWTGTAFSIGSTLPITGLNTPIASAYVAVPSYSNGPYKTTGATNTPVNTIVPYVPYSATNGLEIPINAQRTQFIETGSLDFSGVTITTNVDFLPQFDSTTGALNGGTIAGVETQDFLGEVWPCVDPASGDILRVKMYSSVLTIQDWLDAHPGAQAACNIFIRYSPYDNYPDYVVSTINGVWLSVNPGAAGGPSRIGDATLFNPALLTQTQ